MAEVHPPRRRLSTLILLAAPAALAVSAVIGDYTGTAGHPAIMLRPGLVLVAVAAFLQGAAWLIARRLESATAFAMLGIALVVDRTLAGVVIIIVAGTAAWRLWSVVIRGRSDHGRGSARFLVPLAMLLLGSAVIVAASRGAAENVVGEPPTPPAAHAGTNLPSLYVLFLDGYPRHDMLQTRFGYANSPFLSWLAEAGFDVYPDSHSDYDWTRGTLVAMLSGEPYPEGERLGGAAELRRMRRLLGEAPALTSLASAGYETVTIRSPVVHTAGEGWHRVIDTGQINDFEIHLLAGSPLVAHTPLQSVVRAWLMDQHRDRVRASLAAVERIAERGTRQAALAHLLVPHTPFIFDERAEPADEFTDCWPRHCRFYAIYADDFGRSTEAYEAALVKQVRGVNRLITRTVEKIVAADPSAVVVLMSDHGARHSKADPEEHHATLLAARTPGHPNLLADEPVPDRLFERILDAYRASE